MSVVHIYTDPELAPKGGNRRMENCVHVKDECDFLRIPHGTQSGNSSVAIVCDLPDGK